MRGMQEAAAQGLREAATEEGQHPWPRASGRGSSDTAIGAQKSWQ